MRNIRKKVIAKFLLCVYYFVFLQPIMINLFKRTSLLAAVIFVVSGCQSPHPEGRVDLRLQARIDSYNKQSFMNRYQDPQLSLRCAYDALHLMRDSLPSYLDGALRAYNNLSFGYYMLAQHDSSASYIDSVTQMATMPAGLPPAKTIRKNVEVERVISQLMQIRLLQRSCRIADSYQLLYDINRSNILHHNPENYLYSFAQMEYYITSLTLNYHYRNRAVASSSGTALSSDTKQTMADILTEAESARSRLKCDYAEEMSLNYALAHSYYRLAAASDSDPLLLGKAYDYLADNARILSIPGQYCVYHLANVFQLQAFIAADTNIFYDTYSNHRHCRDKVADLHASFAKSGEDLSAREYDMIYPKVIALLDQLVSLLGDEKIDMDAFAELLDAGFSEIRVGVIPSHTDYVQVGDLTRSRLRNILSSRNWATGSASAS